MAEPVEVCGICGKKFFIAAAARECEAKEITGTKGITVGGRIVISGGDGTQEKKVSGFEFFVGTHQVQFVLCGADKYNIRIVEPAS